MDPLSLTASIIAIVGIGGQAAKAVRKLASLKDAPDLLLALNNELSDLRVVVLAIQDVFQKQQSRATEARVDASVVNSLRQTKETVLKLEALYDRLDTLASWSSWSTPLHKATWLREQKRVRMVQEDLGNVRLKLAATLGVLNL